jgi:hypothetical protein
MGQLVLQGHIAQWAVEFAFWSTALLPVVLLIIWDWRKAPYGPALVTLDWLASLALLPSVIHRLFNVPITSIWFGWFEIVVLCLIPVRSVTFFFQIYRLQRNDKLNGHSQQRPELAELPEPAQRDE